MQKFCNKCGAELRRGDNFCLKCGAKRISDIIPTINYKDTQNQTKKD